MSVSPERACACSQLETSPSGRRGSWTRLTVMRQSGRVLALGGWGDPDLVRRISVIRGTFALQQALHAWRDGDEGELADGLRGYQGSW
ncbi:hypothetical protein IQ63_44865 [Streptomyces acidiscabies]|uniref:Uncharacterized protein n=1 Tax=Streptomyces acidiscabies TaxID=42234 RepID=A0A0L0JCZ7_9ACTN|nr:hypothetical protein IQ63_44865 [Streptomyces acidiscabies]